MADQDISTGKCLCCGKSTKQFISSGKFAKYCSLECSRKRKRIKRINRDRSKEKKYTKQDIIDRRKDNQKYQCVCIGCGKEYINARGGGEGFKYCSRKCAFDDYKNWMSNGCESKAPFTELPKYSQVEFKKCVVCGSTYTHTNQQKMPVCGGSGSPCSTVYYGRIKTAERAKAVDCKICGVRFSPLYGNKSKTLCSDGCIEENNRRANKRTKATRRARKKCNGVIESIDPIAIFIRDRWTCQSCGCDTPGELRGTLDDDAPELDHVLPLSRGGDHTDSNVQCLCRTCNQLKHSMTEEEFSYWKQGDRGACHPWG